MHEVVYIFDNGLTLILSLIFYYFIVLLRIFQLSQHTPKKNFGNYLFLVSTDEFNCMFLQGWHFILKIALINNLF